MRKQSLIILLSTLVWTAGSVKAADSDEYEVMGHRFQLFLGGFFPDVNSEASIIGETLPPGPGIDFENVFGVEDSKSVLWGGARWRISRRNHLEFEFVKLDRTGSVTGVTDPVEVGDSIIQAGAEIDSTFDVQLGRLTYGFSLFQSDRLDIQVKAGLHIADASASIAATGAVCVDGEVPPNCTVFTSTPRVESGDITAPLPHLGASFIYGITPALAMRLSVIGFAMELDNVDGSIMELDADLLWNPWKRFGVGAGVRYFNVSIDVKGERADANFDFDYLGPTLYFALTF